MPPPRRSYATPEETFGITRKPLNDWLDFAASGLPRQGPAFSTELEDANIRNQQRELQSMQLQRDLASEEAASNFLSQAAGKNPQGLMRMLADSPEILGSKDAPMIQDYVSQRQAMQQERQARQPLSNKTLGPALARSLTDPMERMEFEQRLAAGEEAADAYQGIQEGRKTVAQQAARQKAVYDAIAEGAIEESDVDVILNSENPDLAIAAAKGRAKRSGKVGSGETPMEQAKSIMGIIKDAEDIGDTDTAERFRKMLADIDFTGAKKASPSTGAVVPQGAFDAAQATAMGAPAATDVVTPASVPEPTVAPQRPLSAFEAAEAKRVADRAASGAMAAQELNAAWTGAKDAPVTRVPAAEGTQPQRLMNLAKAAVVGEPIQGATKQEQQLAQLMADYAARAAAGETVNVGTQMPTATMDVTGGGDVAPLPVESENAKTPGYAFLLELGGDPEEIITIPGAGRFGGVKQVPAWQLMDMRLKEIGQPLIDRKAIQKQTEASEAVKTKAAQFRGQ